MFNKFYNYITGLINNRFVYQDAGADTPQSNSTELPDDPLNKGINLETNDPAVDYQKSQKQAEDAVQEAQKQAKSIDDAGPEKGITLEEANAKRFEHEVNRAKLEVGVKVEEQFGGLMRDIKNAGPNDLDFHYNRVVKTFENMKNEMDALEFIAKGVSANKLPEDSDYAKQFKKTVENLTDKARQLEKDGKPEIGGLTFDQIISIMVAARKVHYKSYKIEDFKTAKLDRQKKLEEPDYETDAKLASLLGEEKKTDSEKEMSPSEILAAVATEAEGPVGELAYIKDHLLDADEGELKNWVAYISRVSEAIANAKEGTSIDEVVTKVMKGMGEQVDLNVREKIGQENMRWLGAVAKMAGVKPGEGSTKEVAQKMFDNIMTYKIPSYKKDTLRGQFELNFG